MEKHEYNLLLGKATIEVTEQELARRGIDWYIRWMMPSYVVKPHHKEMFVVAERLLFGVNERETVSMPPRHGKSEIFSRRVPEMYHGLYPERYLIHVSHTAMLSNAFSLTVRETVRGDFRYRGLFPRARVDVNRARVDEWRLTAGGLHKSVGVGGALAGFGGHLILVDDPLKEGDERSATILRQMWEWYVSGLSTRLMPSGNLGIIATRWDILDLIGRVQRAAEESAEADEFIHLVLPALAEKDDPIGRKLGEALWEEWYPRKYLLGKRALSARYFDALYQQRPRSSETVMFVEEAFGRGLAAELVLDGVSTFWTVDLALGDGESGDYTALVRWAYDGALYVVGVFRKLANWPYTKKLIGRLLRWYPDDVFVFPKQTFELMAVQELRFEHPEHSHRILQVAGEEFKGDKRAKAQVYSDVVEAGRAWVVEGRKGDVFIREHCDFPGEFDDLVDCSSVATHHLGLHHEFFADFMLPNERVAHDDDVVMREWGR